MAISIRTLSSTTTLSGLLVASALLTAAPATAQEAVQPLADAQETGVGDIIVTARKRAEDILKTPIAVTAITSELLAAKGIVSINDVVTNTPGINVSNVSSGRSDRSFQQITLRGFTPSTATSTLTASFIDGVPVASATALNSVTDPARIEILKGPQAAYFGRNTFAGAVNVVTKTPGNDISGIVSGQYGSRDNQDVNGAIEGAIVPDVLSVRFSGRYYNRDGSYTNGADRSETLGDQRTVTGTALVVLKPTSRLTIKGFGLITTNNDGPSAQGQLSTYEVRAINGVATPTTPGTTTTAGTVIVPSFANCVLSGFTAGLVATETRVNRPGICGAAPQLNRAYSPSQNTLNDALVKNFLASYAPLRVVSPKDGVHGYGLRSRFYHIHFNVDYELGDSGITLSSLFGHNNERYSELADLDNYDSRLVTNPANPTGANPNLRTYWDFPFLVERKTLDYSQEFRASYDKGPIKAIIGASYLWTRSDSDLLSGNGVFVGGVQPASSARVAPQKSINKGVFGGVTYKLGGFSLSAEGRYQEDKIFAYSGGLASGVTISANNQYGLPAGVFGPLTAFYTKTFKNFLPRIIGQYEVTPDIMVYGSWSKGVNISLSSFNTNFLNGSSAIVAAANAIDLRVVVKPEKLTNYEIGLKGKMFDGKLRASIAAYYAIWTDQQNNRSVLVNDLPVSQGGTGVIQIVSGVANSGKSILKGIESEVTLIPVRGLTFDIQTALNDSSIRSFADPSISKLSGVIGTGFRGNQLPNSSKYSANVGAQYSSDIPGIDKGAFFIRGDYSYKSRIFADAANQTWIKHRTQVNFRAGVSKGPYSLEGFIINAFNNRGYYSIANNAVLTPNFALASTNSYLNVGLPELRTYGVKAAFKF